jgi:capsular exopolysaccharide synthesis family protein
MSKNFELMQEALRETSREPSEVPEASKIVVLGAEPGRDKSRTNKSKSLDLDAVAQQECLKLVQRLFLGQPPNVFHSVVFAGIDRGNGCSRICVEAAQTLAANASGSVCLVDANFRSPSLSSLFGVPEERGLANSVLVEGSLRNFVKQLKPSNLWLLSAGNLVSESPSLLNSERLKLRLQELRQQFDFVLIDVPALNLYADAIALGTIADGVVVVLEADSTRRESALKGLETLREAHVEILGAVLNRRTFPIPDFVYRRL